MYRANLKMSIRYFLSSNPSLLIFLVRLRSSLKSMKKCMSPCFIMNVLVLDRLEEWSAFFSFDGRISKVYFLLGHELK